jgi:hypothetical protein
MLDHGGLVVITLPGVATRTPQVVIAETGGVWSMVPAGQITQSTIDQSFVRRVANDQAHSIKPMGSGADRIQPPR